MLYLIGIDIGTSGTKAIALTPEGQVLNTGHVSYEISSPAPGAQELDPNKLLDATVQCLSSIIKTTDRKYELSGISFSSAMHSLMAVDKDGKPLTNIITWADLRSKGKAAAIRNTQEGRKIYERSGTPIHPMSPLCKLMWMNETQPEIFQRAFKFISIKEFIWFNFFGKYQVDYSLASGTGLFDIYELKWFEPSLRMAGIQLTNLSEAVSPTYQEQSLSDQYKSALGLNEPIPFIIGGSDGCLANLGSNAMEPGALSLTIGTSGAVRLVTRTPKPDIQQRIFNYILTEDWIVSGGPINNGGNAVKWWIENFVEQGKNGLKNFDDHVRNTNSVPAGSDGLIFLPYLFGERAPIWDANARAVFFGILPNHGSQHFLKALLEGIGFSLYQIALSLEETVGPIDKVLASGGFIQSETWLQIIADIFNKNVFVMNVADASAIGAAIMGYYSIGVIRKLEEGSGMIQDHRVFEPNAQSHQRYMQNFSIYIRLYEKLKDEFELEDSGSTQLEHP
ncbi:MAG: gluconate kinase [Bacteroidetes bacterium]|nr:MAG: gluconate kinase [Bacteroidota bacterium]